MTIAEFYLIMIQEAARAGDAQAVLEWSSKHAEAIRNGWDHVDVETT